MMTKVLVLVADRDDPKRTEITVLDDTAEAARLIETLLEAGVEREQIRIFSGAELHADVRHRLVVALENDNQQMPPAEEAAEREQAAGKAGTGAEAEASQDSPRSWFGSRSEAVPAD